MLVSSLGIQQWQCGQMKAFGVWDTWELALVGLFCSSEELYAWERYLCHASKPPVRWPFSSAFCLPREQNSPGPMQLLWKILPDYFEEQGWLLDGCLCGWCQDETLTSSCAAVALLSQAGWELGAAPSVTVGCSGQRVPLGRQLSLLVAASPPLGHCTLLRVHR